MRAGLGQTDDGAHEVSRPTCQRIKFPLEIGNENGLNHFHLGNMKWPRTLCIAVGLGVLAFNAAASVRYVDLNCTNATPPYTDWSIAATNIQDAIDAASAGDFIVVSNGVYKTGGRAVYGTATNRVTVDKAVVVQSLNGAAGTTIAGFPGTANAPFWTRCVYLTNGASLVGFTLTNGSTTLSSGDSRVNAGGGVWCEGSDVIISNCVISGNVAGTFGGGVFRGALFNSILTNNFAAYGGGAASNSLFNCTLMSNKSGVQNNNYGGGAYGCTLSNCLIVGNQSFAGGGNGGGAAFSLLTSCVVSNNNAGGDGGGLYVGTANHSLISSNGATGNGGGACSNTLNNCLINNNQASFGNGGGVYSANLDNCVVVGNKSVQGSGGGAAYSTITSCVFSNNSAFNGGGLYFGTANNSLISSNRASSGGGAYSNILVNCVLNNNFANGNGGGGGAYNSTLANCIVVSNTASFAPAGVHGGGVYGGASTNCIIYYNTVAGSGSNFFFPSNMAIGYCCTTPLPTNGVGNITNEPVFVDLANGDFHLQSNSPCINAGNNSYITNATDLDGNPRIAGGTVDIGAYEFQSPASIISYAYLQQYGLPMDGSADDLDSDGDGLNNWKEWKTGTIPTNAASVLQLSSPSNSVSGMKVKWQSVSGVTYYMQRSTNLTGFISLQSNLVGQAGSTTFTDVTATNGGPFFYRVGVQ
jgi:hypothetical protein